ncbi:MAG: TrbI/VirB10 family protein [Elusimicrobiota bacterium]|jgi:type IV secretion system protein VirB10
MATTWNKLKRRFTWLVRDEAMPENPGFLWAMGELRLTLHNRPTQMRQDAARPRAGVKRVGTAKTIGLAVLILCLRSAGAFCGEPDARRKLPEPWKGVAEKSVSKKNYALPTGFVFPARLENAIYSFNVETPAIAVVERNVTYRDQVVIPAETRVIGTVSVLKSNDRILIHFHTLVFKDGDEVKISAIALSIDGSAGLKGKVETHKDAAVANTVLRSLVNGGQTALDMTGVSPIAAQATQGVSQEAMRELDTERQQQVTTSIWVDAETGLRIYLPQRLEY